MSVLKDLDPAYAKIDPINSNSAISRKLLLGMLGLLLLSLLAHWMVSRALTQPRNQTLPSAISNDLSSDVTPRPSQSQHPDASQASESASISEEEKGVGALTAHPGTSPLETSQVPVVSEPLLETKSHTDARKIASKNKDKSVPGSARVGKSDQGKSKATEKKIAGQGGRSGDRDIAIINTIVR